MSRVTIAGGGIAALEAVLALRDLAPDCEIELLSPRPEAEYRPLAILEPYSMGEVPALRLEDFAREQRASVRRDTLVAVEPESKQVVSGTGERIPYEFLLVAAGARMVETLPGAIVFRGYHDRRRLGVLIDEVAQGGLRRVAFAVPDGQAWTLPAYELALLAAASLRARGASAELSVITPEREPLALFGEKASKAVAELLERAGVTVHSGQVPERHEDGAVVTGSGERIETDRVVALPLLVGPRFGGLPSDEDGFIPTDHNGRVIGLDDVYAAGDVTSYPVKQGGLATQQADAAAAAIAARLGADVEPMPFRPVLRGVLLAGQTALPLEQGADTGERQPALFAASRKVVGRYLLPYLTGSAEPAEADVGGALSVELDLEPLRPPTP